MRRAHAAATTVTDAPRIALPERSRFNRGGANTYACLPSVSGVLHPDGDAACSHRLPRRLFPPRDSRYQSSKGSSLMPASFHSALHAGSHEQAIVASTTPATAPLREDIAGTALRATARFWFAMAVIGQLVFAVYVLGFYGRLTLEGHPERWNQVMPHGYVAGHAFFNTVLGLHLAFVVAVIVGGVLQLLPRIRRLAPGFHRWNGRAYLLAAAILSIGGLAMVWLRGGMVGDLPQHLGVSLNAVLILGFAGMTWQHARARRFDRHRRWALRLFLAVSGVWFFRIGLMFWIVVNRGPVGFDAESFTGPFLSFLSFAQYLIPLGVLELHFRVQKNGAQATRVAMAACLGILTLMMMAGVGAATALMWLPHLRA